MIYTILYKYTQYKSIIYLPLSLLPLPLEVVLTTSCIYIPYILLSIARCSTTSTSGDSIRFSCCKQ